jgi:bifunctional non-homologous end joining protein LigD
MATERRSELDIDPTRRDWRPQEALLSRRTPPILDPLLEPLWDGVRVLAHFRGNPDGVSEGRVALIDIDGTDVTHLAPRAATELRGRVMASEAVIDGVLTDQALDPGIDRQLQPGPPVPSMSPMNLFMPRRVELYEAPIPEPTVPTDAAFVAVDLLSVDDQPLLDLPLLERKRQLDNLFAEDELLRVSPYVRPPVGPWFTSWRSAGFRGLMMKASNSRYKPGEFTPEWVEVIRLPRD